MSKKIFIGLVEISGYYRGLTIGLQKLGYTVDFYHPKHKFDYGFVPKQNILCYLYKNSFYSGSNPLISLFFKFYRRAITALIFLFSIFYYDCFIFSFGTSFFKSSIDLKIIKFLNKRIIVYLGHGSEGRPPYIDGAGFDDLQNLEDFTEQQAQLVFQKTKKTFNIIAKFEKFADVIIGSPLSSQLFSQPFVSNYEFGIPLNIEFSDKKKDSHDSTVIKIVHCPSHRASKGSTEIKNAVFELKNKYQNIEYIELSQVPNHVVISTIAQADLVIDQLYSDFAMSSVATEAALAGVPVVIGGYGWDENSIHVKPNRMPPSLKFSPDNFLQQLDQVLAAPDLLKKSGDDLYLFMKTQWSSEEISKRFQILIENQIPSDWYLNPLDLNYFMGYGLSHKNLKILLKKYIQFVSIDGLFLQHRPDLISKINNFIANEE